MIKETYTSFEVAKLLKEKGFNEPSCKIYDTEGNEDEMYGYEPLKNEEFDGYTKVTHQIATAWLREKDIIIVIQPVLFDVNSHCTSWRYEVWYDNNYEDFEERYSSYEEATEKALLWVLNNLI